MKKKTQTAAAEPISWVFDLFVAQRPKDKVIPFTFNISTEDLALGCWYDVVVIAKPREDAPTEAVSS